MQFGEQQFVIVFFCALQHGEFDLSGKDGVSPWPPNALSFAKTAQKSLIVVGFLMIEAFPFGSSNQLPNSISVGDQRFSHNLGLFSKKLK